MPDQPGFGPGPAFEPATREAWCIAAAQTLGENGVDAAQGPLEPGLTLRALHSERPPTPRPPPRARAGWQVRALIAAPEPGAAETWVGDAVEGGADFLELRLDAHGRAGQDPVAALDAAAPLAGAGGLSLGDIDELDVVLRGVDLAAVGIAIDGGVAAAELHAAVVDLARARGIDPSRLRIEAVFAPADGLRPTDAAHWRVARAAVRRCRALSAESRALCADGTPIHDAGAGPALEIGVVLASAAAALRAVPDGAIAPAEVAARMTARCAVGTDLLTEVAKLRALRLGWTAVARAFALPESARTPFVCATTSRRALAGPDPRTNLLRTAIAATAAVCGGADALVLPPDESDLDRVDAAARARALHQHALLREEAFLDKVDDPLAGAFAIEALTEEIADSAWQTLRALETRGGLGSAAAIAWLEARVAEHRRARDDDYRSRRRVRVGISRFAAPSLEGPRPAAPTDAERARRHAERAAAAAAAEVSLAASVARSDLPAEPLRPAAHTDVHAFEQLRTKAPPTAALMPPGTGGRARARADWLRDLLTAGDFEVVELTSGMPVPADATVIGLCCDDDERADAVRAARAATADRANPPALVVAGAPAPDLDGVLFAHEGCDVVALLQELHS